MKSKFYFQTINRNTGYTLTWNCCKQGAISDDDHRKPMTRYESEVFNSMLENLADIDINTTYEFRIFPQDASINWF